MMKLFGFSKAFSAGVVINVGERMDGGVLGSSGRAPWRLSGSGGISSTREKLGMAWTKKPSGRLRM
jgi:hypothetical protein